MDAPRVPPPTRSPVILFDGVCNLCSHVVLWVIARDRRVVFRFASLQSAAGARLLARSTTAAVPDSLVLVDARGVATESAAVLGIARHLGWPWSLVSAAVVLPRPLRDAAYRWIARRRYAWFGRREACLVPTPELAIRFLDAGRDSPPAPQ